jgi:hypothetical protein
MENSRRIPFPDRDQIPLAGGAVRGLAMRRA